MPRGGPRRGKPGASYPNRTDLQTDRAPAGEYKGQTYGTAVAQQRAQQAMPVRAPEQPQAAPVLPPGAPKAGSMGDLLADDDRPDEPVTAGAALGPGPGPEALGLTDPRQDALRRDYEAFKPYVPVFVYAASRPSSPTYVAWVQQLLSGA